MPGGGQDLPDPRLQKIYKRNLEKHKRWLCDSVIKDNAIVCEKNSFELLYACVGEECDTFKALTDDNHTREKKEFSARSYVVVRRGCHQKLIRGQRVPLAVLGVIMVH